MLKEDFIPVWEAVAPVRTVTFDLGEGRKLKGSVSGEIAIYFCDPKGGVFDILPALQSPAATLKAMKEAKNLHNKLLKIDDKKPTIKKMKQYSAILSFHKKRMKAMAAKKYDTLLKAGVEVLLHPEKIPASTVFPKSAAGESKRENYINAATDQASRDLRSMTMSKSGAIIPPSNKKIYTEQALTVVEPGGRGYYLWQIGQIIHGIYPKDIKGFSIDRFFLIRKTALMTPNEWKQTLFEDIFKQELKGGEVEYNSDSLEAINVFEE